MTGKKKIKAPLRLKNKKKVSPRFLFYPYNRAHILFYKMITAKTSYLYISFFFSVVLHHRCFQVVFFCFTPFPPFACLLLVSSLSLLFSVYISTLSTTPPPYLPSLSPFLPFSPTNHPYPDQEHRKGSPSLGPPTGSRAAALLAAHAAEPLLHETNPNYPQRRILSVAPKSLSNASCTPQGPLIGRTNRKQKPQSSCGLNWGRIEKGAQGQIHA